MQHAINFEALSTKWEVIAEETISKTMRDQILEVVSDFEHKYSRFIPSSLVSRLNRKEINPDSHLELSALLRFGKKLEDSSNGSFSLHVGKTLSKLGYGKGTQDIDLGGFGKGWLIDLVAEYLRSKNTHHFMINAGGDIYATTKKNDSAWTVGLEHPTQRNTVIGTIALRNQSLACSAPGSRTWHNHHHLIDTSTESSATWKRAVYVVADSAKVTDGIATTLYVSSPTQWPAIAKQFQCEYLVLDHNAVHQSKNFSGELFLKN